MPDGEDSGECTMVTECFVFSGMCSCVWKMDLLSFVSFLVHLICGRTVSAVFPFVLFVCDW